MTANALAQYIHRLTATSLDEREHLTVSTDILSTYLRSSIMAQQILDLYLRPAQASRIAENNYTREEYNSMLVTPAEDRMELTNMKSPQQEEHVSRGLCYICSKTVLSTDPRDFVLNQGYRHKSCKKTVVRGKCPHCEKDVIVGESRKKHDSNYWHSDCYTQHEAEEKKRETEEKRQAEEKRKQEEIAKRRASIHAQDKCRCVLCEKSVTCAQKHTTKFDRKYTAHRECMVRAEFKSVQKKRTEEDYTESYYMQDYFCDKCGEETGASEDCGFVNGSFCCQKCKYSTINVGTCRGCKCNITMQDRSWPEISKDSNGETIIKNIMHDNLGYHCYACVEEEKKSLGTLV